jgi:cysteinyl-tRNA synthetase
MHNNMVTVNGAKMSKSLGNFITLPDLFAGTTTTLSQAYSPMVVRFFLLQAHYRSPIDLSDDALQAARKGYRKLMNGLRLVDKLVVSSPLPVAGEELAVAVQPSTNQQSTTNSELIKLTADLFVGLDDDLNTARSVASLFNLLRKFNTLATTPATLADVSAATLTQAVAAYRTVVTDILGLQDEPRANAEQLLALTLSFYAEAKADKAYDKVDLIRAALKGQGIVIKDTKAGVEWAYSEE